MNVLRQQPDLVLEPEDLKEVLQMWTCIFHGVQVISNREAPLHRDGNSNPEWYDLLATVGPYEGAVLELPGVGLRLVYSPGTVVGLGGKVLQHGISGFEGERVCVAYYMRANVHERLGLQSSGWRMRDM
jgi:hypothetical protein